MLNGVLENRTNLLNHILEFSILSMRIFAITTLSLNDEIPTHPVRTLDFAEVLLWLKRKNTAVQSVPDG